MRMIDKISTGHEDLGFFIDDIGVWNDSWKYHTVHLIDVIGSFRQTILVAKPTCKYLFGYRELAW
jgi:hypothetical protein